MAPLHSQESTGRCQRWRAVALASCTLALSACTTVTRDSVIAPPSAAAVPAQPSDTGDATVDARLTGTLARVERVMRPLCDGRCGAVGLLIVPGIESDAHARVSVRGYSLIEVREETVPAMLAGDSTVLFWVVAHEYGHHLDITWGNGSRDGEWGLELRAEALAGCALERAGLSVEPVLDASRRSEAALGQGAVLAEQFGADGAHPHWRHMRHAILAGYAACAQGARSVDEVGASVANLTAEVLRQRSPLLREPVADPGASAAAARADDAHGLAARTLTP